MSLGTLWAVVPVKEIAHAKARLAPALEPETRRALALAMLEDVLTALAASSTLSGILVVTADDIAAATARRYGATISESGARDGQTGAVAATADALGARGAAMLTVPGDVPLIGPDDIAAVVNAHRNTPGFTIVPSHNERGSNAVLCSPADAVPLRFGEDSFFPHLDAARRAGIEPTIVRSRNVALDIDEPADLAAFLKIRSRTRTRTLLEASP